VEQLSVVFPTSRVVTVSEQTYLFRDRDLRADLAGHEQRMLQGIDGIGPDEFLKTSPDDLALSVRGRGVRTT